MAEAITEQVRWVRGIFNDVCQRNMHRRSRELEDHRYYSAINHGQWTRTAIERMTEQGRPIITWNFIKKHIDTEAGMLLQNPFEFTFDSEIGQDLKDSELMNEIRFRDKDLGRWGASKTLFVVDGLINTGVMEIFIDRNKDPLGAINFRRRIATDLHFDPDWRTNDVKDNRQIFEGGYFDPIKIMEEWGDTIDKKIQIKQAFEAWQVQRAEQKDSNGMNARSDKYDVRSTALNLPEEINGKFLVQQMQELEDVRVNKLFNRSNGSFLKERLEDLPQEDRRIGFQLLQDREKAELVEIPTNEKKLMVKTIAPGLSQEFFLANDPHEIQIGNYPFTVWSAYNDNGERYGKVEVLKDPQATANKARAIWLHWQMVSPNANKLMGPSAFLDPEEKQRYNDTRNRGGGSYDVNDPKAITTDERGEAPQDLEQTFNDAMNFADRAGAAPSAQAQSKAGTSGVLFDAEREQAAVSLEPLNDGLEKSENDMGEQFVDLALSHYGDDVARSFKSAKDQKNIFINTEERNRIQNMSRMSVRINQAPVGASIKRENLQILVNLRQAVTSELEQASIGVQMIPLIPGLTEDKQEALLKSAEANLETATLNNQVLQAQAQAQLQQLGGGQPSPVEQPAQQPQDPELESLIQLAGGNGELSQESETQGVI
jgi:hypothetical protein